MQVLCIVIYITLSIINNDHTSIAFYREFMKLIIAIIKPFKMDDVHKALMECGVHGITVTEVKGFGTQKGHTESYRGVEYEAAPLSKLKIEVAVSDDLAETVINVISKAAKTGKIGDGKIMVLNLEQAIRVRTDETGDDAL